MNFIDEKADNEITKDFEEFYKDFYLGQFEDDREVFFSEYCLYNRGEASYIVRIMGVTGETNWYEVDKSDNSGIININRLAPEPKSWSINDK